MIAAVAFISGLTGEWTTPSAASPLHPKISPPVISPPGLEAVPAATRDWERYDLRRQYRRAGGVIYRRSALTRAEFAIIEDDALRSMDPSSLSEEEGSSFATNRVGARISETSDTYRVLSREDGSLSRLVNCLADGDDYEAARDFGRMVLAPDVPIEVRVYERTGAGMGWHVDDVLYSPEQIEVVLTLENTSDCWTMWKPHDRPLPSSEDGGTRQRDGPQYAIRSEQTRPNSALVLGAGGVEHKVSPLTAGRRTILKMAFVREGASMVEGMEGHTSHHRGKKKSRGKGKRGTSRNGRTRRSIKQKR